MRAALLRARKRRAPPAQPPALDPMNPARLER
jgi:hypothetical protein